MENVVRFLQKYIDDNVTYESWQQSAKENLSLALAGSFEYCKAQILHEDVLLMKPNEEFPVGKMQRWLSIVRDKSGLECVLVLSDAAQYTVKKLLMDRTAFIVSGKQVSLPFLAMYVKNERKQERKDISRFAPGTQMIFLYLLYNAQTNFTQEEIVNALCISPMTAVRGMNDLVSLGLVSYKIMGQTGRKKVYHLSSKEDFYHFGKTYLDNPVRNIMYVDAMPEGMAYVKSDLTALAGLTMLAEPAQETYAIYSKNKVLLNSHIMPKDIALQESMPKIQLMKYDIGRLAENGCVDPLTLILSLTGKDERIDMAIKEMMGGYKWYEE